MPPKLTPDVYNPRHDYTHPKTITLHQRNPSSISLAVVLTTPDSFQMVAFSTGLDWDRKLAGNSAEGHCKDEGWWQRRKSRKLLSLLSFCTMFPGLQSYLFQPLNFELILPVRALPFEIDLPSFRGKKNTNGTFVD